MWSGARLALHAPPGAAFLEPVARYRSPLRRGEFELDPSPRGRCSSTRPHLCLGRERSRSSKSNCATDPTNPTNPHMPSERRSASCATSKGTVQESWRPRPESPEHALRDRARRSKSDLGHRPWDRGRPWCSGVQIGAPGGGQSGINAPPSQPLDPSEAQRLSRLRVLLSDARRRVGDESELGLHVAVVAVDGVGRACHWPLSSSFGEFRSNR